MHYLITLVIFYLVYCSSTINGKNIEIQYDAEINNGKANAEAKSLFYGMDAKEQEIFKLLNNHRQQYGLPALQPSVNLAYVARTHAIDIVENNPDVNGGNMHSWSDKGKWKPVRYTSDHAQAALMWSKPSEISNYRFTGYEISFGFAQNVRKTVTINPIDAVNAWKNSKGHNDVIIQQGGFQNTQMKAMGAGVYKGYACVWFGEQVDTYPAPVSLRVDPKLGTQ